MFDLIAPHTGETRAGPLGTLLDSSIRPAIHANSRSGAALSSNSEV